MQFGTEHAPRLQCPFRWVVSTHSTSVVANKPPESQHIALGVHWVAGLVLVTGAPVVVANVLELVLKAVVEAVAAAEVVRTVVVMPVVVVVAAVLGVAIVVVVA